MMSAKLLRLQTTEEGQAGFGAEQLKVVLNAFFQVRLFDFAQMLPTCWERKDSTHESYFTRLAMVSAPPPQSLSSLPDVTTLTV